MTHKITLGTVSHGTLRTEDLLSAFSSELSCIGPTDPEHVTLLIAVESVTDFDGEEASDLVNDLADALNEYAPDGCYFGAHDGDGSDFGFWSLDDQE
jgi:hypothetical protein